MVEGFNLSVHRIQDNTIGTQSAALIEDVAVLSADSERYSNQGEMATVAARCRIGARRIVGGSPTFSLCALSVQTVSGPISCFVLASLLDNVIDDHVTAADLSRLTLNANCLLQGTKLQVLGSAVFDSNGFAVFDTDGTAIVIFAGGFAGFTGLVWGNNNALVGIECVGAARVAYRKAFKPIVTGTGGDTIVGDDGTIAYAAIPLFNVSDGSAIVESDGP